ncbi:MAG: phage holin family protein [Oscillospiraceae bacterium]|nr:phage holin family protein [Oscillospiraceae bacterium]
MDTKELISVLTNAIIGTVAGALRTMIELDKGRKIKIVRLLLNISLSAFLGVITGWICKGAGMSTYLAFAIVGVVAVCADGLVSLLMRIAQLKIKAPVPISIPGIGSLEVEIPDEEKTLKAAPKKKGKDTQ